MPDREQLVRDHVELENAGGYAAVIKTFKHPRYEYVATDEVYDGAEEVLLSLGGKLQTLAGHPWAIGRGMVRRVTGR
jgi:hypothetical protein